MNYEQALSKFLADLKAKSDEYYKKNFSNLTPPDFELERGRRYDRVVTVHRSFGAGDRRSAHSFVVRSASNTKALGQTRVGDIHKAATWKAPAKHARGTIFADTWEDYGVGVYGAKYLA